MTALLLSVIMMIAYMPAAAFAASEEQAVEATGKVVLEPVKIESDVELADSDELLWDYLNKELAERTGADQATRPMLKSSSHPRGDRLTGMEKVIYDNLKSRILDLVNPESGASNATNFSFTFADLLGREGEYPVVTINVQDDDGSVREARVREVPIEDVEQFIDMSASEYAFNMQLVSNALLADLPYALYWYDKTKGWYINYVGFYTGNGYAYFEGDGEGDPADPGLEFNFIVAEDYQGTDANGVKSNLLVDSSMTERAYNAVQTADEIVSNPADTAYNTLVKYKDKICELVDYDHPAAETADHVYGDPWQMINVFDGDPATKTVCEGYSKAFQYLCDNTPLIAEAGVDCDCATGTLTVDGESLGNHMWNILHMENGQNYIADLTNCDDESVGYPDKLFLTGCDEDGSVDSGYTYSFTNGGSAYKVGFIYNDTTKSLFDEAELVMAEEDYIHVHEWTHAVVEKRATVDETGLVRYTCDLCGDDSKTSVIPKLDPQAEPVNGAAEAAVKAAEAALESGSVEEAEKAAAEAAGAADAAVSQADEALTAAEESGDEADVSAAIQDVADALASQAKAQAIVAQVNAKKAADKAAESKAYAAKASKGTTTAVNRAKTALEDAKAAANAADDAHKAALAALKAVRVAGFGEDSDEVKAASEVVTNTEAAKTEAETAVGAATTALTKAQNDYTAEKKRQGTYNKSIPKVKIKAPSSKKTSVTVKWTRLTAAQVKKSKVTKYEIWLCPNTKFAKADTKIKTVLKSKSSVTFTGLKKSKTYYVKVRAIKYVKGVKNVGKWSLRKTIKTKRK